MTEQTPVQQPEQLDRRAERLADPSRPGAWITGLILIALGTLFLLRNAGTFNIPFENWWALFILIPAIGSFDTALRMYRHAGHTWTAPARGSILVGLVLTFVTATFLFGLSWAYFGPILIILVGVGILITYMTNDRQ